MKRIRIFAVFVVSVVFATFAHAQNNETASPNDTARFLAGMQLPPSSPLAQLAEDPNIKQHATYFDTAFDKVEKNQLAPIRAWSAANLNSPQPVVFYMFGGPDFLYANAFFPNATTYVLSGLEPVGQIPDLLKLPRWTVIQALRNIQVSLRTVLSVSYFITTQMRQDLNVGSVNGTLPILYVFLVRSGKIIHDVTLVHLDEQGTLISGDGARPPSSARGVKISFSENDGPQKTLYYFSTNLADERGKNNALLQFNKSLGQGDSFIKSASYLMHYSYFSQVRNFILDNSSVILQDDSGIPVKAFDKVRWQLRPFGRYLGPIPIFQEMYQPKLEELYQRDRPGPIGFGVGYRWYANESNLLLATRDPAAPEVTASVTTEVAPRKVEVETAEIARAPVYRGPPKRQKDEFAPFGRPDVPIFLFPFLLFAPPPPP